MMRQVGLAGSQGDTGLRQQLAKHVAPDGILGRGIMHREAGTAAAVHRGEVDLQGGMAAARRRGQNLAQQGEAERCQQVAVAVADRLGLGRRQGRSDGRRLQFRAENSSNSTTAARCSSGSPSADRKGVPLSMSKKPPGYLRRARPQVGLANVSRRRGRPAGPSCGTSRSTRAPSLPERACSS